MTDFQFPKQYFGAKQTGQIITPEQMDARTSRYRKLIVKFIKELPQNAVILDAGCGNGKVLRLIETYRPDVRMYAVDISDVGEFLPIHAQFTVASVEEVGTLYEANQFDAIFCLHVIEHLLYPMNMMLHFKKVLKPGGNIYMETPNWVRIYLPFTHMFFWNDYTHVRPFSKFALRKLFSEHGFSVSLLKAISSHTFFIKDTIPQKATTPASKQENTSPSFISRVWGSFVRRVVYPFIKDTLVIVAQK